MAVSGVIPQAPPVACSLGELLAGITDLETFFKMHQDPPLPWDPCRGALVIPFPVEGTERGERLVSLAEIAEKLGVREVRVEGALVARRWIWPFLLEARVDDDEEAASGPAAVAAAEAGSGAAA